MQVVGDRVPTILQYLLYIQNLTAEDVSRTLVQLNQEGDYEEENYIDATRAQYPTLHLAAKLTDLVDYNDRRDDNKQTNDEAEPIVDNNVVDPLALKQDPDSLFILAEEELLVDDVFGPDRSVLVPVNIVKSISSISDLQLQIGLQAERTNILRYNYSTLRQILSTVDSPAINQLALTSNTVKKHLRSVLRPIPIRRVKVLLILAKLDTATRSQRDINKKAPEEDLYFLDVRDMFSRLLLSDVSKTIYQGIANIVDVLSELYKSRVQASSIRTISGEFVYYLNAGATAIAAAPTQIPGPY